jgi:uncharacterized protein
VNFDQQAAAFRWRDVDIFWVLFFYAMIVLGFLLVQSFFLGSAALDDLVDRPVLFLIEELVDTLALALVPCFVVLKVYDARLGDIGITPKRLTLHMPIGVILGGLLFALAAVFAALIEKLFDVSGVHPYFTLFQGSTSLGAKAVILASLLLLGPISEEIFFRGFAYGVLRRNHGKVVATIGSATLFAAVHFSMASFLVVLLMGIILAAAFERTSSLSAPIAAHSVFNLFAISIG